MAGKRTGVPDAWDDDDWEAKADRAATEQTGPDVEAESDAPMMTKAQRLAQHAESNRKLWQSAEAPPEPFHYLAARTEPPLASDFKPAVKVLSRKPAPKTITKRDPLTGALSQLKVADDEDSDDDGKDKTQLSPEEIRAKQQREREEKQRRYEEVRAKIFGTTPGPAASGSGTGSNPSSGTSTPGNATPPRSSAADGRGSRSRGRGRGGTAGSRHRHNDSRGDTGSSNQRPGSQSGPELYDPNYSPKPSFPLDRRGGTPISGRSTPRDEDQLIRSPRGPDGTGRGFAKRGGKTS
ncbi:hypothetical protein F4777DRAFT_255360 [Nemania sp. FL0916]|nr:hypothetical protein F4777DRAFT_255360 [Nemania sp. FL0916]